MSNASRSSSIPGSRSGAFASTFISTGALRSATVPRARAIGARTGSSVGPPYPISSASASSCPATASTLRPAAAERASD